MYGPAINCAHINNHVKFSIQKPTDYPKPSEMDINQAFSTGAAAGASVPPSSSSPSSKSPSPGPSL